MSFEQPIVTAIIVTYNSRDYINKALEVLKCSYLLGTLSCVVVDNDSKDKTVDFIEKFHPWVRLIQNRQNLGFGRGCNLGSQQVETPYVLIHNPDAVLENQHLKVMVNFMESHPRAGVVAPAIKEAGCGLQEAGMMTTPTSLLKSAFGLRNAMPKQRVITPGHTPFSTNWVCGAMMLIRTELFERLKGFDPRYFLYFEETDFCRRALKEGAQIWTVGEAVAHHLGGASAKSTGEHITSNCISEHFYRSRYYYLLKHFGLVSAVGTATILYLFHLLRHLYNSLNGRQSIPLHKVKYPFLQLPSNVEDRD